MTTRFVDPSEDSAIPMPPLVGQEPDWLDAEAWKAFKEMRKAKGKRAPFTPTAEKRLLWELDRLRAQGHDPAQVLWQSVVAGWSSVYPLKHTQQTGQVQSFAVAQTQQLLKDQEEHAKKCREELPENKKRVSEMLAKARASITGGAVR